MPMRNKEFFVKEAYSIFSSNRENGSHISYLTQTLSINVKHAPQAIDLVLATQSQIILIFTLQFFIFSVLRDICVSAFFSKHSFLLVCSISTFHIFRAVHCQYLSCFFFFIFSPFLHLLSSFTAHKIFHPKRKTNNILFYALPAPKVLHPVPIFPCKVKISQRITFSCHIYFLTAHKLLNFLYFSSFNIQDISQHWHYRYFVLDSSLWDV